MVVTTIWTPSLDIMKFLDTDKRGEFATRRIKTLGALLPCASVYMPCTMLGSNGWSVNIAQCVYTIVVVLPNSSL